MRRRYAEKVTVLTGRLPKHVSDENPYRKMRFNRQK